MNIQTENYSNINIFTPRSKVGIAKLDDLLGTGVLPGSSFLVSGSAGTGKTTLLLEFIYRGAKEFGEKGILFTFEETIERILAHARGMKWDIDSEIKKGNIEIVFIPRPNDLTDKNLEVIQDLIKKMAAKRVAIDSSVFVHNISEPLVVRKKMLRLATFVKEIQAIGLFSANLPFGGQEIDRFSTADTFVDGIILLTTANNDRTLKRERFMKFYKLRNPSKN